MKDLKEDWSIAVSDKEVQPGQERGSVYPHI